MEALLTKDKKNDDDGKAWLRSRQKSLDDFIKKNGKRKIKYKDKHSMLEDDIGYEFVLLYWDWEENNKRNIYPNQLTKYAHTNIHGTCMHGHKYEGRLDSRIRTGCPICSNKTVLAGYNDLATTNPELASQFCIQKNLEEGLGGPEHYTAGSNKPVWWKCPYDGHSWKASIKNRTSGNGCPKCKNRASKPELIIYYYLKDIFNDIEHSNKDLIINPYSNSSLEIDIYSKDANLAIEYDGRGHHRQVKFDKQKEDNLLKYNNSFIRDDIKTQEINKLNSEIKFIRMRENGCGELDNKNYIEIIVDENMYKNQYKNFDEALSKVKNELSNLYKNDEGIIGKLNKISIDIDKYLELAEKEILLQKSLSKRNIEKEKEIISKFIDIFNSKEYGLPSVKDFETKEYRFIKDELGGITKLYEKLFNENKITEIKEKIPDYELRFIRICNEELRMPISKDFTNSETVMIRRKYNGLKNFYKKLHNEGIIKKIS